MGAAYVKALWLHRALHFPSALSQHGAKVCREGEKGDGAGDLRTGSCNYVEEFELNPEGTGELLKYLEERSGRVSFGSVCKGRQEFCRKLCLDQDPAREGGVREVHRPWGSHFLCPGVSGGQDMHLVSFLHQQQDDLGAAFQTWMDTNGALRPEVPPGAVPTWYPFLGETYTGHGRSMLPRGLTESQGPGHRWGSEPESSKSKVPGLEQGQCQVTIRPCAQVSLPGLSCLRISTGLRHGEIVTRPRTCRSPYWSLRDPAGVWSAPRALPQGPLAERDLSAS
jgi:hypothetical protein